MTKGKTCFRHPDRQATGQLKVPCAPHGVLNVCAECAEPANARAVFEHYQAMHSDRIVEQRLKDLGAIVEN